MTEQEIHLVPPRSMADGNPPRVRVRVGDTVRRTSYAWSPAVIDLLRHVEREGFNGAPRARGFDDQGREVLTFIRWDTAAPGPRVWELGWTAWRWVPFVRDEMCRAIGLPIGVADKARRFRVPLDAYGIERDLDIVHAGIERSRQFLEHQLQLAARGSEWEVELARRGFFDEAAVEIAWVEENAVALVES